MIFTQSKGRSQTMRVQLHQPCRRRWLPALLALLVLVLLLLSRRLTQPADTPLSRRLAVIARQIRSRPVVNRASYPRLLSPQSCRADTALLVLVTSAPANWERRQAIRDTWGAGRSLRSVRARLLFLLGDGDQTEMQAVRGEAGERGDILQEGFRDSYHNLTLKTMMGLRWASESCVGAKFVVKTDDDIYWNLPLLLSHLNSLKETRFITGCIKQLSAPAALSQDGRPAPPGHPQFTAGAGYVISGELVSDLYQAALRVPLLPVEDVFITGYSAKVAHAWPPTHDAGFSCGDLLTDDCDLVELFNAHKITPARQYLIWGKFASDPNPCMDF